MKEFVLEQPNYSERHCYSTGVKMLYLKKTLMEKDSSMLAQMCSTIIVFMYKPTKDIIISLIVTHQHNFEL